jgi:hypothetical protein
VKFWASGENRNPYDHDRRGERLAAKVATRMAVSMVELDLWLSAGEPPVDLLKPRPAAGMTTYPVAGV